MKAVLQPQTGLTRPAMQGGYNVDAIANSSLECVKVLLGETPPPMQSLHATSAGTRTVHLVTQTQSRYWDCMAPTYEGREGPSE